MERLRERETLMRSDGHRERQYLACLLTKGYRAVPQIAYSHERICNEKQYVTKLPSHTHTHTHTHTHQTGSQQRLLAFHIHNAGIDHQRSAQANAFNSILIWRPFPRYLIRFSTLLFPVSQQMSSTKGKPTCAPPQGGSAVETQTVEINYPTV